MEAEPRRPWLTPEALLARRGTPAGPRPPWWTGTVEDQFTPIYLMLGREVRRSDGTMIHGTIPPPMVDEMDLTTIWAFLGGNQQDAERRAQVEALRVAPDVPMRPLTATEKAERLAARQADEERLGRRRRRSRS